MCEQCMAKTRIIAEALPDWLLVKASQDGDVMKAGQYGLVRQNDPDFWWTGKPIKYTGDNKDNKKFWEIVELLDKTLDCNPMTGYDLVRACKKAGYRPDKHGFRLASWLQNRMATVMSEKYRRKHG